MLCRVLAVPIEAGAGRAGCRLGPQALRAAGLLARLREAGHSVEDLGVVRPGLAAAVAHPNRTLKGLPQVAAWLPAIAKAAERAGEGALPIFLGGDHVMTAGTLAGTARLAARRRRPLFVLWLDAHPDFHTLDTTTSGNLHGVPLAYASGRPGFEGYFPRLDAAIDPSRICVLGARSIDPAEQRGLMEAGVLVHDMRALTERGVVPLLAAFLARVAAENGMLHVSLDADFLDPAIAPGVGTPVGAGVNVQDALLIMDTLRDSGRVTSLDLVELNPLLDEGGRTAALLVDLTARLVGQEAREKGDNSSGDFIDDRPAQSRTVRQR